MLTLVTAGPYLVQRGVFHDVEGLEVVELAGGISGAVFAVRGEGKRVVVKQALERFRVEDEWLVPPERALDEAAALELMAELAPGSVPALIDLDGERFVLVMEEAPDGWRPWKALLLEGVAEPAVARRLGELLGVTAHAHGGRRARLGRVVRNAARRSVPPHDRAAASRPSRTRSAPTSTGCSRRTPASSTATTRRRTSSSATTVCG